MTKAAKFRLTLYILIGTLPTWINWVTLQWDLSVRGLILIVSTLILNAAVNFRAFIDTHGKPPNNNPRNETPPAPPNPRPQ